MGRGVFVGFLLLLCALFGLWAYRVWSGKGEVRRLREEYLLKTGLPLGQAYDALERHLERMISERPGMTMSFYLRTALAELKRDRR
jgi:hypothetical protein